MIAPETLAAAQRVTQHGAHRAMQTARNATPAVLDSDDAQTGTPGDRPSRVAELLDAPEHHARDGDRA